MPAENTEKQSFNEDELKKQKEQAKGFEQSKQSAQTDFGKEDPILKEEKRESPSSETEDEINNIRQQIIKSKFRNFWWINANPDTWKIASLSIGEEYQYSTRNKEGNERRVFNNFFDCKPGELALGYETAPTQKLIAIFEITKPSENRESDMLGFKLIYLFRQPTDYRTIFELPTIQKSKTLKNLQGSIFKITYAEFKAIVNTTEVKIDQDPIKDDLPSYTDNPELEDKLGREPIAKSVVAVVRNIWPDTQKVSDKYGTSFMVHIQGPWGSGKSTFLNLIEKELKKFKWVVISYNAWQHQHIDPPWWTMLDTVFKQAQDQVTDKGSFKISELLRRWRSGSFLLNLLSLFLLTLTITVPFFIIPSFFDTNEPIIKNISTFVALVAGLIALFASINKSMNQSLLWGSSDAAKSFARLARDPMEQINLHFKGLVKNIRKPVAIFIDDLDRCEPEYTIRLLEGIQTLFRNTQVLYVVAADKNWIAKCFEIHYENFTDTITQKGTRLGYLFIQKAFQLSVRMPILSATQIENYWDYILKVKTPDERANEKEAQEMFASAKNKEEIDETIKDLKKKGTIPDQVIRTAAVNKLNEQKFIAATENELQRFSVYMEPNPRAIKRLANFYNVFDRTLILEGRELDISVKVRWLLLSQRWPILADELEKQPGIIDNLNNYQGNQQENLEKILALPDVELIIQGINGDEPLTETDINDCIGWEK